MKSQNDTLGYYAILGVTPYADITLIKKSYYERAKQLHPDHNQSRNAVDTFQKLSVAYDVLNNPLKRAQYDMLSLVYAKEEFPMIGSLKIYKNQSDQEDVALRVLKQKKIHASLKQTTVQESKDICNIREAGNMVLSTSVHNWLCGWWGKGAISKTLQAIRYNYRVTTVDDADNLRLLIHNAVAYAQEKNYEKAWIYAQQVKNIWVSDLSIVSVVEKFINVLGYSSKKQIVIPYWNAQELRLRQILFPILMLFVLILSIMSWIYHSGIIKSEQKTNYYYTGGVGADTIENKIMKTDSNDTSVEYLVHFNKDTALYHGPDNRYDVMKQVKSGQTVRITGYTPDKVWFQVITDNGERGYTHKNDIDKGMGNQVPYNSKVYRN